MATGVLDASVDGSTATRSTRSGPWRRRLRVVATTLGVAAVGTVVWWGPRVLARLDYFHVHRVEFEGVRYAKAAELLARLALDTAQSVWQPTAPLAVRVATHPLVASAEVRRRLPGTVTVRIVEREPVALVPGGGRLQPADGTGQRLPIDPTRAPLDLPLATSADSALLATLEALRRGAPALYARVTQAERVGRDELRFRLGALLVRTTPDVTVSRFRDILPVEADLARQSVRAVELDLRFRDQVIARQP